MKKTKFRQAQPPSMEVVDGLASDMKIALEEKYPGKVFSEAPANLEARHGVVKRFEPQGYPSAALRIELARVNNGPLDFHFFIQGSTPFSVSTNPLPTQENMQKRLLLGSRGADERDMVVARIPEEWENTQGVALGINSRLAGFFFSELTLEVRQKLTEAALEILRKRQNGIRGEEHLPEAFEWVAKYVPQLGITSSSFTVSEDDKRHGIDRQQFVWSDRGGTERFVVQVKTSERDASAFAERYPDVPVVTCYLHPFARKDGSGFFEESDTEAFSEVLKDGTTALLAEYLMQAITVFRAGKKLSQPRNPLIGHLRRLVKNGDLAGAYCTADWHWAKMYGDGEFGWRLKVYLEDMQGRRGSFYAMALRERFNEFLERRRNPKAQAFLLERPDDGDEERIARIIELSLQYSAPPVWRDRDNRWRRDRFTERTAWRALPMSDITYAEHLLRSLTATPSKEQARVLAVLLHEGKLLYTPQLLAEARLNNDAAREAREELMEFFQAPMWQHMYAPQESA